MRKRRDSVMVGDSTFDMAMARDACICAIGVSWGYNRPEALRESGAEAIVHSYAELLPPYLSLNARRS